MSSKERDRTERLATMGKALRNSLRVPTDTYITGDIPLLLTLLSKVPGVPDEQRRYDPAASDRTQSR